MNSWKLSWKNLWARPLNTLMSLLLLTLGIGIISLILLLNTQINQHLARNAQQIDMVLGAKGSPLQLILASMYHIDAPTGNISKAEAERVLKNPLVQWSIPLAYGDNYEGYRIVGTLPHYLEIYSAEIQEGVLWSQPFDAVIGQKVAQALHLTLGSEFHSAHGLSDSDEAHDHHHYRVVGILAPSGSVLDQLILTSLESVWQSHVHEEEDEHSEEEEEEITAMLVKFKSPMGMLSIPRNINEGSTFQAALPAIELNRLYSLLGFGMDLIKLVAMSIIVISGVSIFISLYNSLKERRFEIALLRTLGASRWKVFSMILGESLLLTAVGCLLGLGLGRLALFGIAHFLESDWHYQFNSMDLLGEEWLLLAATLCVGLLAGLIPAWQALKTDISKTLSHA